MLGIISFICLTSLDSNAQLVNKVIYGDEHFMKLSKNKRFYDFKEGLEDGVWIAFYDSVFVDSALMVTVAHGQLLGAYKCWDQTKKYVTESGNLKYGERDGTIYLYLIEDDGIMYINIEKWVIGKFDGYIKQEF